MTADIADFQKRYRQALLAHLAGGDQSDPALDALELGKSAITDGQSLLDLLAVHHGLIPSFASDLRDKVDFARISRAEEFLAQVAAPFEMIHQGWRDMVARLRQANEMLERQVAQRTADLGESEQRFRDIAEVSGDWLWETDAEHRFTFVSGEELNLPGQEPGGILGKTFEDLFGAASDLDGGWQRFKANLDARLPFRRVRCSVTTGTQPLHLSISGTPVFSLTGAFQGYRGAAANETVAFEALRRAQAAETLLRDSHGRLNAAFNASPAAIIGLDTLGKVILWNRAAHLIYGWAEEEVTGKPLEMIPESERDRAAALFTRSMSGESFFDEQGMHLTKEGRELEVTLAAAPLRDGNGHQIGALYVINDVTHKLQIERQLRQAQKMEAVGQLTGGVAHDFNNILMVIMANADALEETENPDPLLLERIKGISNATQRAAELTRQLLAFSRKQALRPQRTNINDLVAATGRLLRRTLGEQIEIESILADNVWTIEIDRAQLESALVNLSINARDAMPGGGRLLLETRNETLDEDYVAHNPDAVAGDYVMLAVTDTGSGMPPDILNKVFEPFFTTKGIGKGTGLGLSMVYGFIRQSGGHIKIYSEVGSGTSIRLYLPRTDGRLDRDIAGPRPPMPRGSERILVVEDDAQVRASVVGQLRNLGYAVAEASDGAAGLAAFETGARPYDLLLTDVIMPGPTSGKALADEVMRRWPETKVVFMSGYTDNAIIHQGRLDVGVRLLSKPFRKSDLAQTIRQALDGSDHNFGAAPSA